MALCWSCPYHLPVVFKSIQVLIIPLPHPTPPHPIPPHPIPTHPIPPYSTLSHPNPSHPNLSHPLPLRHTIPAHPTSAPITHIPNFPLSLYCWIPLHLQTPTRNLPYSLVILLLSSYAQARKKYICWLNWKLENPLPGKYIHGCNDFNLVCSNLKLNRCRDSEGISRCRRIFCCTLSCKCLLNHYQHNNLLVPQSVSAYHAVWPLYCLLYLPSVNSPLFTHNSITNLTTPNANTHRKYPRWPHNCSLNKSLPQFPLLSPFLTQTSVSLRGSACCINQVLITFIKVSLVPLWGSDSYEEGFERLSSISTYVGRTV